VRVLGLDTATWRATAGVVVDGAVRAERFQAARGNHAVTLLPLIDEVLQAAGLSIDDVDGIAVSNGPGSFSGLRVALGVAKGMVCATGAALVAVATLEALARSVAHVANGRTVCPVLDARKGEVYAAAFQVSHNGCSRLLDDGVFPAEAVPHMLPRPCVVVGDALVAHGALFAARLGREATLLPVDTFSPRGGTVGLVGWERLRTGERDDPATLEPFYIRPPDAERKAP
jgi:tRNA threonylcarbamoyladenosine biosynthesis protein TsaB